MRSLHCSIALDKDRIVGGFKLAKSLRRRLAPPVPRDWIDVVVDRVSIKTAIPGRVRFVLDFTGDEILADTLRRELQRLPTVRLDSYSIRTRTALVTYDPKLADGLAVTTAVLAGVRAFARIHGECDLDHHHHSMKPGAGGHSHGEDCDHDHSATATDAGIRKELLKLTATGAALGYFLYRRLRSPASSGSPLGPLADVRAILTIATGYPIFRSGFGSIQRRGKATDAWARGRQS